jgi:hypothetical protein
MHGTAVDKLAGYARVSQCLLAMAPARIHWQIYFEYGS